MLIWISIVLVVSVAMVILTLMYLALLGVIMIPLIQARLIYRHRSMLSNHNDLDTPERFGFLHNQVTSFRITANDHTMLHVWHILPLGVYRRNFAQLVRSANSGNTKEFRQTWNFRLLRDDPGARLVISMHGAGGTLASGCRPQSYRNLYSAAPERIHILSFDYRGFGLSTGRPSEQGLLADAITVFRWATEVAHVPPERIVIFGHSLGSAVAIALATHLASRTPAVSCAGLVLAGSFSDIPAIWKSYRIGGIPILLPSSTIKPLFAFLIHYLQSTWLSKDRIAEFVRRSPWHQITIIHAEDDPTVPATHADTLFWHAVNGASEHGVSYEVLQKAKERRKIELGESGWTAEWRTKNGLIRQDMLKSGLHNKVLSYPIVGLTIMRAFQAMDSEFKWL